MGVGVGGMVCVCCRWLGRHHGMKSWKQHRHSSFFPKTHRGAKSPELSGDLLNLN